MERYYEAIDLLKGMISRPSFSRDETAVADFLQAEWQKAGQKVFRKGNNLWIIAPDFDFGKPTLLLNSHIDTVKPASGWTKDPFTPEETEDDQLYGYFTCMFTATRIVEELDTGWFGSFSGNIYIC